MSETTEVTYEYVQSLIRAGRWDVIADLVVSHPFFLSTRSTDGCCHILDATAKIMYGDVVPGVESLCDIRGFAWDRVNLVYEPPRTRVTFGIPIGVLLRQTDSGRAAVKAALDRYATAWSEHAPILSQYLITANYSVAMRYGHNAAAAAAIWSDLCASELGLWKVLRLNKDALAAEAWRFKKGDGSVLRAYCDALEACGVEAAAQQSIRKVLCAEHTSLRAMARLLLCLKDPQDEDNLKGFAANLVRKKRQGFWEQVVCDAKCHNLETARLFGHICILGDATDCHCPWSKAKFVELLRQGKIVLAAQLMRRIGSAMGLWCPNPPGMDYDPESIDDRAAEEALTGLVPQAMQQAYEAGDFDIVLLLNNTFQLDISDLTMSRQNLADVAAEHKPACIDWRYRLAT